MLYAETSGECGFQTLKISSGADHAAQGGCGAFHTNDAFGFLSNPAAALFNKSKVVTISQNYWIFDTTINCGAFSNSNGKSSFAFAYRYLDYGKLENRDDTGVVIGKFHPMDMIISLNIGHRITPDHYAGINVNALYEKIDTASSFGYTFDLGYTYITPIKNLKFSAALKHLGKTSEMEDEAIDLPLTGELSIIDKFEFAAINLFTELKAIKNIDDDEMKAACGIKTELNNKFNLKLGYKFNYDTENISAGFGINIKKVTVDYAYVPFKYEIDDVHMIEISYKF